MSAFQNSSEPEGGFFGREPTTGSRESVGYLENVEPLKDSKGVNAVTRAPGVDDERLPKFQPAGGRLFWPRADNRQPRAS
jgi:hypothetical protein